MSHSPVKMVAARRPRRLRIGRVILAVVLLVLAVAGAAATFLGSALYQFLAGVQQASGSSATQDDGQLLGFGLGSRPLTILVLGVDAGAGAGEVAAPQRSDTIMVVRVDPVSGHVGLLSIPRDTRVAIPGRPHPEKIAHAHAYGQARGGPGAGARLVAETVEDFLGLPIDHFVEVDFDAFRAVVDAVGGVDICVEKPMRYTARSQNLEIRLEPGCQRLDGEKALQYVRYRQDGDIFRIERQQKFLRALAQQVLSLQSVLKLPQIAAAVGPKITTDLSHQRMLAFLTLLPKVRSQSITMGMLPGRPAYVDGVSYWLVDEEEARRIALEILEGVQPAENQEVRIQVLNGNGRRGAAARAAEMLERYGFQIAAVGNADRYDWSQTTIEVTAEDQAVAERLQQALAAKVPQPVIRQVEQLPEGVDARVVVGEDFPAGEAATTPGADGEGSGL